MKKKQSLKIFIDIMMTMILFILMGYQFWGEQIHEWAGTIIFILFIIHHMLNWKWWQTIFKGQYTVIRLFQLILNIGVLLAMIALMISGVMLSRYTFAFLNIQGGMAIARLLHMTGAYWGFILMAMHLGMHGTMIIYTFMKKYRQTYGPFEKIMIKTIVTVIIFYGMAVFITRQIIDYMLIRTQFVFLDYNETKLLYYLDYAAMFLGCIALVHFIKTGYLTMRHKKLKKRKYNKI